MAGGAHPAPSPDRRGVCQRPGPPASREQDPRERGAIPSDRRQRPVDGVDVGLRRSSRLLQQRLARRHRASAGRRGRRRLGGERAPRRPRGVPGQDAGGGRRPPALHARLPPAALGRRIPLDPRPRCAEDRNRRELHRLHRLRHRRHRAEDRARGRGREQRPAQRHLRLALRPRRGARSSRASSSRSTNRGCASRPRTARIPRRSRWAPTIWTSVSARRPWATPTPAGRRRRSPPCWRAAASTARSSICAARRRARAGSRWRGAAPSPRGRRGDLPRGRHTTPSRRGPGAPAAGGARPHAARDGAGRGGDVARPRGESAARRHRGERAGHACTSSTPVRTQPRGGRRRPRSPRRYRRRRQARLRDHSPAARGAPQGARDLRPRSSSTSWSRTPSACCGPTSDVRASRWSVTTTPACRRCPAIRSSSSKSC